MSLQEEIELFVGRRKVSLGALAFFVASFGIIAFYGLASWLLFFGFCLLIVALVFLWSSVTSLGEEGKMSLEEALDLAAPARDEERKLAVLRGLKDLEYEHGLGKVSDEDYRSISQRYRHEARNLLQRLDSSDQKLKDRVLAALESRLSKSPDTSGDAATKDVADQKQPAASTEESKS